MAKSLSRYLMLSAALRRRSVESTTISLALGRPRCTTAWTIASTTPRTQGTFGNTASGLGDSPSSATMPQSPHQLVTIIQLEPQ